MKPILECKGLTKQYNNHVNALTNLNLVLERGADHRAFGAERKWKDHFDQTDQ